MCIVGVDGNIRTATRFALHNRTHSMIKVYAIKKSIGIACDLQNTTERNRVLKFDLEIK